MANSKKTSSVGAAWAALALLLAALASPLAAAETGGGNPPMPRDPQSKAQVFIEAGRAVAAGKKIDPGLYRQFVFAQTDGMTSGPAIGEQVPDFTLADQNGKRWTRRALTGAKGLLLVFNRSADW